MSPDWFRLTARGISVRSIPNPLHHATVLTALFVRAQNDRAVPSHLVIVSRAPATFRQSDLTRAIKSALAAGCDVVAIEVTRDGARVVAQKPDATAKGAMTPPEGWVP